MLTISTAGVEVYDRKFVLVDNFADKNKVFRSHGIARFELKAA